VTVEKVSFRLETLGCTEIPHSVADVIPPVNDVRGHDIQTSQKSGTDLSF
jgi:hypothetical protein